MEILGTLSERQTNVQVQSFQNRTYENTTADYPCKFCCKVAQIYINIATFVCDLLALHHSSHVSSTLASHPQPPTTYCSCTGPLSTGLRCHAARAYHGTKPSCHHPCNDGAANNKHTDEFVHQHPQQELVMPRPSSSHQRPEATAAPRT